MGFRDLFVVPFYFYGTVPAIATALGIVCAFSDVCFYAFFGLTINLITMLGLIIVLGMLVDDGIVASENIYVT